MAGARAATIAAPKCALLQVLNLAVRFGKGLLELDDALFESRQLRAGGGDKFVDSGSRVAFESGYGNGQTIARCASSAADAAKGC